MYLNDAYLANIQSLPRQNSCQHAKKNLLERAQAFLEAGLGTPESRDIILGLLLANAQLKDSVQLAAEILKTIERAGLQRDS